MVTMQNIADKAGVSKGTVSYVLNGKQKKARINDKTCTRILAIADQLGYRRNAIAQSMKTGKTNIIGFIGGMHCGYCMDIIKGINLHLSSKGYMIKLMSTQAVENIRQIARQCVEQRLSGVICHSLAENELEIIHKELSPRKIPIVLVDSSFSHKWSSRVISDDFTGAQMATKYLLDNGHRDIIHLTNNLNRGFSRTRYNGFRATMEEAGLSASDNLCVIDINWELTKSIKEIIERQIISRRPTAIFCSSDPIAMKLIIVAAQNGLTVPNDLSIIGYANLDLSEISNPPLTTVSQNFETMGCKAAEILCSEMEENHDKQEIKLPVELVVRNSVKKI